MVFDLAADCYSIPRSLDHYNIPPTKYHPLLMLPDSANSVITKIVLSVFSSSNRIITASPMCVCMYVCMYVCKHVCTRMCVCCVVYAWHVYIVFMLVS